MNRLRLLLFFLPKDFREEYGEELLATAREHWEEVNTSLGPFGRLDFWLRELFAMIRLAARVRRTHRASSSKALVPRSRRASLRDTLRTDMRQAIRGLLAEPRFFLVALLTLGLGIGAVTTTFAVVRTVILRPLPYRQADEVVVLHQLDTKSEARQEGVSAANLLDLAQLSTSLQNVSGAEAHGLRLLEDGRAVSLRAWLVSEDFFETLGVATHLGRTFLPEEFTNGKENVVLLSHESWQSRFSGSTDAVGSEIVLDGKAHAVVGVLPPDFAYPSAVDVWAPRPPQPWDEDLRGRATMDGIARLASGTDVRAARNDLARWARFLSKTYPEANADLGFDLVPIREHALGAVEPPLWLLLGAVLLLLVVAAVNVASLQLVRGMRRGREYALRVALGAGRKEILRLVVLESTMIAMLGGALGLALSHLGVEAIRAFGPEHLPRIDALRVDGIAVLAALIAAFLSSLAAIVPPVLTGSRVALTDTLHQASRGHTQSQRWASVRDRLVIAEVALALVLMIGAGLLVQSLGQLLNNDLGFHPENRLAVQVWAYDDEHNSRLAFFGSALEEIERVPGVEVVGLTTNLPMADDRALMSRERVVPVAIENRPQSEVQGEPLAALAVIDPGYAPSLGVPLVAGRNFSGTDHGDSTPVALINEAFAERHFAGQSPLGHRIRLDWRDGHSREIVGVLRDTRRKGYEASPTPEVYVPLSQEPSNGLTFIVKLAGEIETNVMAAAVTAAMREADPTQASWATQPLSSLVGDWTQKRLFYTWLLTLFAFLALALATIGIYGVVSFTTEQRIHEFGIRRALGGQDQDILCSVLRRALSVTLSGVSLGLIASAGTMGLLESMLYGIEPLDIKTFGGLSMLVITVGALSALAPARRALHVDPVVALSSD